MKKKMKNKLDLSCLLFFEQVIVRFMNKQIPSGTNTGVSYDIILKTHNHVQGYHGIYMIHLIFIFVFIFDYQFSKAAYAWILHVQWRTISEEWSVFVLIPGCIVLWLNHVIRFQNVLFCFQIVRNIKVYSKYFQLTATKFEEACAITLSVSIHYRTYYTWMLNLSQSFQMPEEVKADMKS